MTAAATTTIDWLRFRTQGEPGDVLGALRPMFGALGHYLHLGKHGRGLFGFKHSLPVMLADVPVARLDFGGDSQRGWLRADMPGKGCGFVEDWGQVDALEGLPKAEVRRLDIALTTWRGEVDHEQVVAAHAAGKFTTNGRPPNLRQITNSDPMAGRTCSIGQREAPKFFRAYEKGLELLAKLPVPSTDGVVLIDGHPAEDIYRCELELKADGMEIPWETIERRDQYFSGAYPFCAEVLPGVEPDILQRRPEKAPQRELAAMLANVRTQYGDTLYTALRAYHGDIGAVWDQVVGTKHNQRLVEAGVLLFEHE